MKKRALTLQEHQAIVYDLLYVLDDFCREYNIQYFLTGGTLLGAVRHKGIIPWDDDADVMMPRMEFERFRRTIMEHPIPGYKIVSIYTTKDCYIPFIKLAKNNTWLFEDLPYMPKQGIGINIDIFPLDGCPNNEKDAISYSKNLFDKIITVLNEKNTFKFGLRNGVIQNAKHFIFRHSTTIRKYYCIKLYKKNTSIPFGSTNLFSNSTWGWYGEREIMPVHFLDETIFMEFGNRKLPAPKKYDEYLTHVYGDYMTPPTLENRSSTHKHGDVYVLE